MISTGGYSVGTTVEGKRTAGTMPSELGNLKNWKYVVFGKRMLSFYILFHQKLYCIISPFNNLFNFAEDNGVEGTLPKEFGGLQASETMWLRKSLRNK